MELQFQYTEGFYLLALLLVVALLYLGYRRWKQRTIRRIGDEALVRSLFSRFSPAKERIKFFMVLLAFTLGTVALTNPRKPDMASSDVRKGIDVFLAMDVSKSMLATDVPPIRLQKAQDLLTSLVDKMPNDRIGVILFAGHAYLQMPLSTDHQAAKFFITTTGPNAVPEPGTAIGDALKKAEEAFDKTGRFKTVILVTDGETHDEDALNITKDLAQKGIMVNTVGVGSVEGSTIIDPETETVKKDEAGNTVISKLNEDLLKQIAATTNGTYVHLSQPAEAAAQLLQQYQNVEKKALPDFSSMSFHSYYFWFAFPMLLLLMAEIFIPDKKKVTE